MCARSIRRNLVGRCAVIVVVGISALVLPGCAATYERTEITQLGTTSALDESATDDSLLVTVGDVLTADIVPYNSDGNPMVGHVTSEDPAVLQVLTTTTNGYAFLGMATGSARVDLLADGVIVGHLTATVVAQP